MTPRTLVVIGMVVLAAVSRLVPHPPNFTPVGAMALFAAAILPNRMMGFLLPLAVMLLSDLGLQAITSLGWTSGWMSGGTGLHRDMWFVYGAVALITALGLLLGRSRTTWSIGATVLASSVLFFVVTNFGVWAMWDMYPKTWDGLIQCYFAAVPFFHWTLLGDAFYAVVLFGGFALVESRSAALAVMQKRGAETTVP